MHLQKLAANNLIRCTMELGGHSPVMVFKDADIDAAAQFCAAGKFRNAGQVCISPTRFFVEESVHDVFLAAFKKHVEAVNVGNGLGRWRTMGPLVAERRIEIMDGFVSDAVSKGGRAVGWRVTNSKPAHSMSLPYLVMFRRRPELWLKNHLARLRQQQRLNRLKR